MKRETTPNYLVLGPAWLKAKVARAVGGPATHSSRELRTEQTIAVVHADHGGRGRGPAELRTILAGGALAGAGVAPATAHEQRLQFFEAGAAEVLLVSAPAAEWTHRLGRVACCALAERRDGLTGQQQAFFQAVVDALPVSLYAIDREFRVVVWNRGREAGPLGRPRGQVLGQNLFRCIGDHAKLQAEYEEVFRSGHSEATEVQTTTGGTSRVYVVQKVPMRLGPGPEVTHVITYARDVTAQKLLERSMAQAEKMAAVGRLAAGIAHEINNPLATIAGCAEALQARFGTPPVDEERREASMDAKVIEDEAYRCKEILGGLLDFSRTKTDERGLSDPADLVERTLRLLRYNPRVSHIKLKVDAHPDAPMIWVDEDQLIQVILALTLNAADAAAPSGVVTISTGVRKTGEAVISVEDDGPGIPPEIADHIFEPFFTTKPPGQGTGLGLSVAYGVIQAHGGRLEFESAPGRGTRFDVVLPASVAAPAEAGK